MVYRFWRSSEDIMTGEVKYTSPNINAPLLSGLALKAFVWLLETPFLGSSILSFFMWKNKFKQTFIESVIPELPMFLPEYPEQNKEVAVKQLAEAEEPPLRVAAALDCLPRVHVLRQQENDGAFPFLYWTIRDYAEAYRTGCTTPSLVAEEFIAAVEDSQKRSPPMEFFRSFFPEDIRKQAAVSTRRFVEGNPLSVLDGIFVAIKDDIDCHPHSSKGGTLWVHKVREVRKDAVCVERLRQCGVIVAGKTNMHELGLGVTGNNPLVGTVRNPHDVTRHTGGSSAGSAAVVACGLCPAALGTDDGGSIRIPSSMCGVVGLKGTFGRTTLVGLLPVGCTMESVGPIAATVEDTILVYAAILGSHKDDLFFSKPPPPCLPVLNHKDQEAIQIIKLGKYSEWFYDVASPEISQACDRILKILGSKYGTQITEIVIPELEEMRGGHTVTLATEFMNCYSPFYDKWRKKVSFETRATIAFFKEFNASMYISAQRVRRRLMNYFMEAFRTVDVIVTPATGMTAPHIPKNEPMSGVSDLESFATIMRFMLAGNYLGLPALVISVGHDKNGLPIGLQLIGRAWEEATLLRLATVIEEVSLPYRKKPMIFYDLLSTQ